jgi:hypothetical protein
METKGAMEDALRSQLKADNAIFEYPDEHRRDWLLPEEEWGEVPDGQGGTRSVVAKLAATDNAAMSAAIGRVAEARRHVAAQARERLALVRFDRDGGAAALAALEALRVAESPSGSWWRRPGR